MGGVKNRSIRYKTQKKMCVPSLCSVLQTGIHHGSLNTYFPGRRRGERGKKKWTEEKQSAGGRVNRLSLLYRGHFIHLVGLIKCQEGFLDI